MANIKGRCCISKGGWLCEQFPLDSPPHLTDEEMRDRMAAALAGFEHYIEYLATGELDGYLDSIRCEDKVEVPKVHLPCDPILLIHDLGKDVDQERIRDLFIRDTVFVWRGLLWR
jgi:hypothetical protein